MHEEGCPGMKAVPDALLEAALVRGGARQGKRALADGPRRGAGVQRLDLLHGPL